MSSKNKFTKTTEIDGILGFLKLINWEEEYWLLGIISVHIFILLITIMFKVKTILLAVIFFTLASSVALSEKVNEIAAMNWNSFSTQQYFDSSGLFITIFWNFPCLFNCTLILGIWFWQIAHMLVAVKRGELRESARSSTDKKES